MRRKGYYESPIGILCIEENGECIVGLYLVHGKPEHLDAESKIIKSAKEQLKEYFNGTRKEFKLPVKPEGTEFQKRVWEALQTIPYGETCSYGDIAKKIGNPKAFRAVGSANNKNHIMILIPCHRVVGADGSLVGFGAGIDVKKYLLELEARDFLKCFRNLKGE